MLVAYIAGGFVGGMLIRVFCKQEVVSVIHMAGVVGSGVGEDKHIACAYWRKTGFTVTSKDLD
jgi:hypothetical protein